MLWRRTAWLPELAFAGLLMNQERITFTLRIFRRRQIAIWQIHSHPLVILSATPSERRECRCEVEGSR